MTTDAFGRLVDELGEELLGVQWLLVRGIIHRWVEQNPERTDWARRRIRRLVREGRL